MRKSATLAIFSLALGTYLALAFVSFVAPTKFSQVLIIPVLALFWPYLSRKQNISLGLMRITLSLPNMVKTLIEHMNIGKLQILVLPQIFIGYSANISGPEQAIKQEANKALTNLTPHILRKMNLIMLTGTLTIAFTLGIAEPYLIHRLFKHMKIYQRIPY